MESFQRLVRSLKSARSVELPSDVKAAYFMLLSYVMRNEHRTFADLLATSTTFDVNFCSGQYGRTLLHMAANVGSYECLCLLLRKGATPDTFDRQGITPLQVAARNGFIRCILKLLEHGANITTKNNEGMTAIHWLASNGRTEVLSEIKKYLNDIDVEDENGQTPLHVASLNGHLNTVLKLIELKADVERRDAHGCTPLFFACRHGQANVVKELINNGALLHENHQKETPLFVALKGGYDKVCYALMERDPRVLDKLLKYSVRCHNGVKRSKIISVLSFISAKHSKYRNQILLEFAKTIHMEGMKLLSQTENVDNTRPFLKFIDIFNSLSSYNARCAEALLAEQTASRQRLNAAASLLRTPSTASLLCDVPPENLNDIQAELDTLWVTMEHWLCILQNEINQQEMRQLRTSSNSSRSDENDNSAENKTKQGTYRFATLRLSRSLSNSPLNLEQLRLSQPAYTVNQHDEEEDSVYLTRSESYANALSEIGDDFERTFSPNGSEDGSGCSSPQKKFDFDTNLIDLTADRLCAAIHGYYLYCSGHPAWEKSNGKKLVFAQFVHKHQEVLLLLVSRKSELIFHHFSFVLENPILLQRFLPAIHCQPLDERRKWFYERLYDDENRSSAVFDEESVIYVTRDSILQTSCKGLNDKKEIDLRKNVSIRFEGEQGMGAGVTREWLDLLVKEMLNPDFALFTLSADGSTFQPNSSSAINPDHLSYFQFAGKVMGLALYHKHLITAYFTRSFYKHILGIPVNYKDVESIDPVYSKNLQTILDNKIDDMGLEIPFCVETSVFGEIQEVELKPDGKNVFVNDINKFEYVNLAADLKMTKAIKPQILAFLHGFYQFVPYALVSLFNEYELELLLSGLPDMDLADWRKNTAYQSGFTESDEVIQWFWEVVESFSKEKQVQLLQFVTGTSRVPWGGFSKLSGATGNQQFTICLQSGEQNMLPTASTCFNMLKLPEYRNKRELERKLSLAIECGSQGFEFA